MALNVFHDHNRVIKQQAKGQNNTGEGYHIKFNPHDPHQCNGGCVNHWNGGKDHQHLAKTRQEEEHHDGGHDNGVPQRFEHILRTLDYGILLGVRNLKSEIRIMCLYLL